MPFRATFINFLDNMDAQATPKSNDQAAPESNSEACLRMAQEAIESRPDYIAGTPHEPTAAQLEDKDFVATMRLIDSATLALKKVKRKLYKSMSPSIYLDLRMNEAVSEIDGCCAVIRDQQDKPLSSYLPRVYGEGVLPEPTPVVVDSRKAVSDMLISMAKALKTRNGAVDMSVDVEGLHLARDGKISLIQIFVHDINTVYLVHVAVLGQAAFSTPTTIAEGVTGGTQLTLKTILEAKNVKKLFWDCRSDAQLLSWMHGVELAGVVDVQLCDVATRSTGKERASVKTLMYAFKQRMAKDITLEAMDSWKLVNEAEIRTHAGKDYDGAAQWYIESGGVLPQIDALNEHNVHDPLTAPGENNNHNDSNRTSNSNSTKHIFDPFAQTPLRPLTQVIAINNVRVLPAMHEHCTVKHRFWNAGLKATVQLASAKRLEEGKNTDFKPWNADKKTPDSCRNVDQRDRFATS